MSHDRRSMLTLMSQTRRSLLPTGIRIERERQIHRSGKYSNERSRCRERRWRQILCRAKRCRSPAVTAAVAAAAAATRSVTSTTVPSILTLLARLALDVGATGAGHVDRLGATIRSDLDVELDGLAIGQRAVPVRIDRRLVDEQLLATVVRRDEAEPLGVVEELDDARLLLVLRHGPNAERRPTDK